MVATLTMSLAHCRLLSDDHDASWLVYQLIYFFTVLSTGSRCLIHTDARVEIVAARVSATPIAAAVGGIRLLEQCVV